MKREVLLELLQTLGDFTSKQNWDRFFSIRGTGDSFEWYAEWPSLCDTLLSQLSSLPSSAASSEAMAESPQILVPGCGNSRVSEHLYDVGFRQITNIDFSKIVVSDMLRRNVRSRPDMKWRVMDMTSMQFADESFDVVLDKGGLDALMEPEVGSELGQKYLEEVKRVLKFGGKYICLTLAESHVLALLFNLLRFGWKTAIFAIPNKHSNKSSFQTFLVASSKEKSTMVNLIGSSFDQPTMACNTIQVQPLVDGIETENQIRGKYASNTDVVYFLRDLNLGAQGNIHELQSGRRFQLVLGGEGASVYSYKTVLLDAQEEDYPFLYNCGVFIVPKIRAHEWLFSSEEGQWQIVESSKAARLIMVFLDSSHCHVEMKAIQKDLSPLVKSLAPLKANYNYQIPFMMASDGVKQRKIVYQVTSKITGPMIVEDVLYDNNAEGNDFDTTLSNYKMFRRLVFERSSGLVQSEAMLFPDSQTNFVEEEKSKFASFTEKSKKKGLKKTTGSSLESDGFKSNVKIDHSSLASSYHSGIISGFSLVADALQNALSMQEKVKVTIVGLGAGLFPSFLHICLPFLDIEVVELDPVVFELAKNYFDFKEDLQLKALIGNGIEFIENTNIQSASETFAKHQNNSITNTECELSSTNIKNNDTLKILIIDADSSDLSSGLACPPADFVEEPFLSSVKDFLSFKGLYVINLVSRSPQIRHMIISRLKTAFNHLFSLQLEEDVNEVLFASQMDSLKQECVVSGSVEVLWSILKVPLPCIKAQAEKIRCLK